jgi:hypothetical protein
MLRIVAAALFASLFSLPTTSARAAPAASNATPSTSVAAGRDVAVQTVAYRSRYYRSSSGRRPGTGFTPWYLLPKTDPRRYNGPRYYWNN